MPIGNFTSSRFIWRATLVVAFFIAPLLPLLKAKAAPSSTTTVIAEFGTATLTDENFLTINLSNVFTNPIVVASPRYPHSQSQRMTRIQNKNPNSFQVKVDSSQIAFTGSTDIDWLVFEEGAHTIDLGGGGTVKAIAGTTNVSNVACNGNFNTGGNVINFSPSFDAAPVVLHTVTSNTDTGWVASIVHDGSNRANPATSSAMTISLMRSFNNCTHGAEDIDYIAFDEVHDTNNSNEFEALVSPDTVAGCCGPTNVNFNTSFPGVPQTIIVAQNAEDGGNGGYAIVQTDTAPTASLFGAAIDEDGPSADRNHTTEEVSIIAFLAASGQLNEVTTVPWDQDANLRLWLQADDIGGLSDGDPLSTWADSGINSNDLIQSGANRPAYRDNATDNINFNPVVDFDGVDDFMEDSNGENYLNGQAAASVFFVIESDSAAADVGFLSTKDNAGTDDGLSIRYDLAGVDGGGVNNLKFGDGSTTENTGETDSNRQTTEPQIVSLLRETATVPEFYINGLAPTLLSVPGNSIAMGGLDYVRVGDHNKGVWDGSIAETMIYVEKLSAADRNIVESYLAIKYGITLDQSGTGQNYVDGGGNIIFDADTAGAGTGSLNSFNNDIFGIGQDSGSLLSQSSSRSNNSGGVITISNPSALANGDYLVIGNDNDDNGTIEEISTEVPFSVVSNRLDREWATGGSGDLGTVTLAFDLTGVTLSGTQADDFVLLIDSTDSDFSNGISSTKQAGSFGSNIVTFNNVSLSPGDTFTIGINPKTAGGIDGLQLWIKANELTGLSDNTDASSLNDFSNNGFNAVQPGAGISPNFRNNNADSINFNPVLEFNGTSDFLAIEDLSYTGTSAISSLFTCAVFRTNFIGGGFNGNWAFLDFDRSEYFDIYVRGDNGGLDFSYAAGGINDNSSSVTGFNDGIPHINCAFYDGSLVNDTQIRGDGQILFDSDEEPNAQTIGTANTRFGFIGEGSEAPGFNGARNDIFYDGDIAEVLLYTNTTINSANMNSIESYLAAKYGITLNQSGTGQNYVNSSGTIVFDADTAGAGTGFMNSYANDIAGLIQDDTTALNQTQSRSVNTDSIVTFSNASSLDDGDSIFWGNDNDNNGVIELTSSGVPPAVTQRLDRIWRVHETGDPGTVDLALDLSGLTLPPGTTASDLRLIVDTNTNFSTGANLVNAISFTSNVVTFSGINLDNQAFFTLAVGVSEENDFIFGMPY